MNCDSYGQRWCFALADALERVASGRVRAP